MNKKYLAYALAPALALATMGGIAYASSDTHTTMANDLVTAIAQKFNLNTADVQKVFDDQRAKMESGMQQKFAGRLAEDVSSGKLTQAQADLITAKKAELEASRESQKTILEGKTKEEVRSYMQSQMDSLKQWAETYNIPMQYLVPKGPMAGHGNMMNRGMMGDNHPPMQKIKP